MPGLGHAALLAAAIAAEEATPPIPEAGLWEVRVRVDIPASPVQEATQTLRHCYSRKELEDPRNLIPRDSPECEIVDYAVAGNRVTWSVECSSPKALVGGGEMILGRVAYAANVWSEVQESERILRITQRIRAKRLGECAPEAPPR